METHSSESADLKLLAYGREVNALLSSSNAESWNRELWTMFSGFMLAQNEMGRSLNLCNTFFSFKELLEFFEKVERIRSGE